MAHLLYGFRDLVNMSPNYSVIDISSLLFDDTYLKKLSPKRYNFYVKFLAGLSNPYVLEKFLYKTREAKDFNIALKQKTAKLAELINRLNSNFDKEDRTKIIENIMGVIKNKFKINDTNANKLTDILSNKMDGGAVGEEDFLEKNHLNVGPQPMKKFIDSVNAIMPDVGSKAPPSRIDSIIIKEEDMKKKDEGEKPEKPAKSENIKKLKSLYENYRENLNPETLKISLIDRIIFIATTFIIRYVSLMLISWGLDTNFITDFQRAFYIYCIIYLLFFIFVAMIVNVIVFYPVLEVFTSSDTITLPNLFYYFYIYTNGSIRLIIHSIIIIMILFIPYVINMDKINFNWLQQSDKNISYDYEKKKKIYDSISLFSFIIWLLTSIIALKF